MRARAEERQRAMPNGAGVAASPILARRPAAVCVPGDPMSSVAAAGTDQRSGRRRRTVGKPVASGLPEMLVASSRDTVSAGAGAPPSPNRCWILSLRPPLPVVPAASWLGFGAGCLTVAGQVARPLRPFGPASHGPVRRGLGGGHSWSCSHDPHRRPPPGGSVTGCGSVGPRFCRPPPPLSVWPATRSQPGSIVPLSGRPAASQRQHLRFAVPATGKASFPATVPACCPILPKPCHRLVSLQKTL